MTERENSATVSVIITTCDRVYFGRSSIINVSIWSHHILGESGCWRELWTYQGRIEKIKGISSNEYV